MKQFLILMTFVTLLYSCAAFGQVEKKMSPEDIVLSYYQKIKQQDMDTLAGYMHPDELQKFQEMMLPVFVQLSQVAGMDPTFQKVFAHGDSIDEVKQYSPQQFFVRFLDWVMALQPSLKQTLQQSDIKAIGHVKEKTPEGEQIHVVTRMTTNTEGIKMSKLSVMSLKMDGENWKLMLTGEIEGIAQTLRTQLR